MPQRAISPWMGQNPGHCGGRRGGWCRPRIWKGDQSKLTLLRTIPLPPQPRSALFCVHNGAFGLPSLQTRGGQARGFIGTGRRQQIPIAFPTFDATLDGHLKVMLGLRQLDGQAPEDVAAWLQQGLTKSMDPLVRWWIAETGLKNIVLVGGIFANVELNRTLLETGGEQYYIFPHMGDGGLAMGSRHARSSSVPLRGVLDH